MQETLFNSYISPIFMINAKSLDDGYDQAHNINTCCCYDRLRLRNDSLLMLTLTGCLVKAGSYRSEDIMLTGIIRNYLVLFL